MGQARTISRRQSPSWASSFSVLFKYSVDKARSQYEKSAVLLKVRPGDTG